MFKKICVAFLAVAIAASAMLHGSAMSKNQDIEYSNALLCILDAETVDY